MGRPEAKQEPGPGIAKGLPLEAHFQTRDSRGHFRCKPRESSLNEAQDTPNNETMINLPRGIMAPKGEQEIKGDCASAKNT